MRKLLIIGLVGMLGLASCDKVSNPFPPVISTELDYTLYPGGDSTAYATTEWPTWTANTNLTRSVLIEDFTGHKCTFCPIAADTAVAIHDDYPTRVFVATIHSGPTGANPIGSFQTTDAEFVIDWTNPEGSAIGEHFGSIPGSAFLGNPRGAVSRILNAGQHTAHVNDWRGFAEAAMPLTLQVGMQSETNYYPSTRGLFLHTEIEVLDAGLTNDLYTVVYLVEDSIVGKQKLPSGSTDDFYVHRDVMRGCISSDWQGRMLTESQFANGKYYFNYSYALPAQYNADNMHLLIYVRDAATDEIYQVLKQNLQ